MKISEKPQLGDLLSKEQFQRHVRNGKSTLFWFDKWHQQGILKVFYRHLFEISNFQDWNVEMMVQLFRREGETYDKWWTHELTQEDHQDVRNF